MTDTSGLARRIAQAGSRIDPGLTDRDVERLLRATERRIRRRRTAARGGLAIAAVAVSVFLAVRLRPSSPSPPPVLASRALAPRQPANSVTSPPDVTGAAAAHGAFVASKPVPGAEPTIHLRDGSSATPLDGGTVLATVEDSPRHSLIDLQRGRARFDVIPSATRVFSVDAGDVRITVLGTAFTVERIADRVGVTVERGSVRVDWGVGGKVLHVGESGWFPPLAVEARLEPAPKANARVSGGDRAPPRAVGVVAAAPVEALLAPTPPAAAVAPSAAPPSVIIAADSAGDLLAAADVARLQGHAEEGAAILRRVLRDHEADPRAPLAAFTLGRMLMMELGQPREAASAFARARVLDPGGPFAEDALARETEAWAKAGDRRLAREKATEYVRSYPRGRRVDSVKALGGID